MENTITDTVTEVIEQKARLQALVFENSEKADQEQCLKIAFSDKMDDEEKVDMLQNLGVVVWSPFEDNPFENLQSYTYDFAASVLDALIATDQALLGNKIYKYQSVKVSQELHERLRGESASCDVYLIEDGVDYYIDADGLGRDLKEVFANEIGTGIDDLLPTYQVTF